jgi:signal recognition particle subunit SRP54
LKTLANSVNIDFLEIVKDQKPLEICKRALQLKNSYDVLIFDTAGRLFIDKEMMEELQMVKGLIAPNEILLVADSLTGQEAVNIATEFDKSLDISSIILTRIEGDGRGGAALSMKAVTGKPLSYIGVGEKMEDIDLFHPKRIASRILDKGDIVSLVEKAEELVTKEEADELEKKIKKGNFDLEDLLKQIKTLKKFGGLTKLFSFIPGSSKIKSLLGENLDGKNEMKVQEAIIQSMTKYERRHPEALNSSRKFRIVKCSGTNIRDINSLLKKFKMMKQMVESVGNMSKEQMQSIIKSLGDVNGEIF